jgi:hypothetical protein
MANVDLSASLKDEAANRFIAIDGRTVPMTVDATGVATPAQDSIFNYTNLPACPNAGTTRDVAGQTYLLHITADVMGGKHAEASLHVVPSCSETSNPRQCQCLCRAMGGFSTCMN